MKNLKIGKKFFVTFGIIVVLFVIAVIVSIVSLINIQSRFNDFYLRSYELRAHVLQMVSSVNATGRNLGYATMSTDASDTEKFISNAKEQIGGLDEDILYIRENFKGDMSLVDQFSNSLSLVNEEIETVFDLASQNRAEEASKIFFEDVYPIFTDMQEELNSVEEQAKNNAAANYEAAESQGYLTIAILIIIGIFVFVVTILLALYLTKMIITPVRELEEAALNMVKGNFDVVVKYESEDELGILANTVKGMLMGIRAIINDIGGLLEGLAKGDFTVRSKCEKEYVGEYENLLKDLRSLRDSQNQILAKINDSANQVASGSEQVSFGAQGLSQGATEQASSIQELAATVTEVSNRININAENAKEASNISRVTGEQMVESNKQMKEMINAMDEISKSSNEIGNIIKTIEDIAFQTNILALNATVEAARAGEAGKGFAVVADEVRNLANKSAEASQNTSSLIANSIRAVKNGTKIASETAQSLMEAVDGAKKIEDSIIQISEASNEQAEAITQIREGIDQISSVVQTNSATAEESAATSEELSSQAQVLKNLIGKFKLLNVDTMGMNAGYLYRKPNNK